MTSLNKIEPGDNNGDEKYIALKDNNTQEDEVNDRFDSAQEILQENNLFKPTVFFEFFFYFFLTAIFGPLTAVLLSCKSNGRILMKNLSICGGSRDLYQIFIFLTKVYCIVTTFALPDDWTTPDNVLQFYLVIYTELSLAVLLAGYYSSFTLREINILKKSDNLQRDAPQFVNDKNELLDKVLKIGKDTLQTFFERTKLNINFPEIDLDSFSFVYPADASDKLPPHLIQRQPEANDLMLNAPVKNFILVDGISYAKYVFELVNHGKKHLGFEKSVTYCKILSRVLVYTRVLFPIIFSLWGLLSDQWDTITSDITGTQILWLALFVVEEIGYGFLIYRCIVVYDILFIGILLYWQKLRLLQLMEDSLIEDVATTHFDPLKIDLLVSNNCQSWFHVRRLLSLVRQQMLVIVDVNISYIAIFLLIFFIFYAVALLGLLKNVGFIWDVVDGFSKNTHLVAMVTVFVISLLIMLFIGLIIGCLINLYFQSDIALLQAFQFRVKNMEYFPKYYVKSKGQTVSTRKEYKLDTYTKYLERLKSYIGEAEFEANYAQLMDQLDKELSNVINQLNYDSIQNPHKLLGITTQVSLIVQLSGLVSVFGAGGANALGNRGASSSSTSVGGGYSNSTGFLHH